MTKKIKTEYSYSEEVGAIIGYLVGTDGTRISAAKYNKIAKHLEMDKMPKDELLEKIHQLDYDSVSKTPTKMYQTFEKVRDGKLTLNDVFQVADNEEEFGKMLDYRIQSSVIATERIRQSQKEFKQVQKNGTFAQMLIDDMLAELKDDVKQQLPPVKAPKVKLTKNSKVLLINAADWHLGNQFKVHAPGISNEYNLDIFDKRWYEFLQYNIDLAKREKIKEVYFIHLGDIVEGEYMRPSQGFGTELTFSEQVVRAMKEMRTTLQKLVSAGLHIKLGMIIGNHDRINGNKKDNLYGDGVTGIILQYLEMLIDSEQLPNVELIDNSDDVHDLNVEIAGHNCFFTHGEKIKPNTQTNLAGISGRGNLIDLLVYGHYHNFKVDSGNDGTLLVGCPGNLGWNEYSKSLGANNSAGGQVSMILEKDKTPQILPYFYKE
ncbi:hypothetical protein GPK34_00480 [Secundilactobacillus kimchicus]|uniref:metallophosphoesterase family protein n=1 Tax=Secundilactobacillus kimchicus TaxID=528209 RepID=UPI001C014412|nr:metallophosphoesterase family protein [Secundilactobacillus kimchicus]MBT9670513.1 hypothetical protein [Secundilactobacillus kimchicus]